jgi:UTP-glucose-1-phosphate uridylyltransferase
VGDYFKNVLDLNRDLQNKRQQQLMDEIRKDRKGVQIRQVQ